MLELLCTAVFIVCETDCSPTPVYGTQSIDSDPIGDASPRYFHLVHSSEWLFLLPASPGNYDPVGSSSYNPNVL
jgi:hypothetical protein